MMIKLKTRLRNIKFRTKGFFLKIYLLSHGCKIGINLKCKQWPILRSYPNNNIYLGNNVNIGYRITLDVKNQGKLIIGNNVNLTQDIIISAASNVTIGHDTLIGEFVSIRDADHGTKLDENINSQELVSLPIKIKDDVWIASGVRVLKGAIIEKSCVIAANSVVLSKSKTIGNKIYGGLPVKIIGERK